jgi:hypothetical protein
LTRWLVISGAILAVAAWNYAFLRSRARKSSRTVAVPEEIPQADFVGGLRSPTMQATWPLVRFQFFEWGIRLRGSVRLLQWVIPAWEAHFGDIAKAEMTSFSMGKGVRIFLCSGEKIVFVTSEGGEVLDQLESHGVHVERSPKKTKWSYL